MDSFGSANAESDARAAQRPLSPHLSVYRPMMTMMMSMAHRITGAALFGVDLSDEAQQIAQATVSALHSVIVRARNPLPPPLVLPTPANLAMRRRHTLRQPVDAQALELGAIHVDVDGHRVTVGGDEVHLTVKEFDLLAMLISKPGRVFTREELMSHVWGEMPLGGNRTGHDEYTHYYFAQAVYMLGDDGYMKLFPGAKEADTLTWTKYRKEAFDNLVRTQSADGSWSGGHVGPVFITSVHVCIMQLDKACLPIYQR